MLSINLGVITLRKLSEPVCLNKKKSENSFFFSTHAQASPLHPHTAKALQAAS
jgi:hypothetical protein